MSASDRDDSATIVAAVAHARTARTPLYIRGGGTRTFYGRAVDAEVLDVSTHRGVVSYQPSELVVTARAGTALEELEVLLADRKQMLPFEPPRFAEGATLGGAIACGMSGPRRAYCGAARDFVLGVHCVTGRAELLRFGGQVIKNVAGYDVSRLMTGALGTLGVLMDISIKVLPQPQSEITLQRECTQTDAIRLCNQWAGQPLPLSASSHHDGVLRLRLSGAGTAVAAAAQALGGDRMENAAVYWCAVRDQTLPFFRRSGRLWRLPVPPATLPLTLAGDQLVEWGGALRWLWSDADSAVIRNAVSAVGGHATLYRGALSGEEIFHPLEAGVRAIQHSLKRAFDPDGILNPGRMYAGI